MWVTFALHMGREKKEKHHKIRVYTLNAHIETCHSRRKTRKIFSRNTSEGNLPMRNSAGRKHLRTGPLVFTLLLTVFVRGISWRAVCFPLPLSAGCCGRGATRPPPPPLLQSTHLPRWVAAAAAPRRRGREGVWGVGGGGRSAGERRGGCS